MNAINTSQSVDFHRLKQCVSMHQVLERYGLLTQFRRSGDTLSGVCPLHRGSNPTQFRVSNNCWICFGDCQAGGSIIDFVSRMERVGIREAALLLQDWFSVGSHSPVISPPHIVTQRSNAPLRYTLNRLDYNHPYLKQRGLTRETVDTFGVGYCRLGYWRDWIVIAIHDREGRPVAYAGRWPGKPQAHIPKYKLPRGFHKSVELYNQHRAAREDRTQPLVVVEGFWGCMHVWQAGHRKVVSLMGSMMSRVQEERIVALASEGPVLLLLDEDVAGQKGRADACGRLKHRVPCEVVSLPLAGQQPDSLQGWQLLELIQGRREVAA
jgi:DNA primase